MEFEVQRILLERNLKFFCTCSGVVLVCIFRKSVHRGLCWHMCNPSVFTQFATFNL
jgi:hypothetical protein